MELVEELKLNPETGAARLVSEYRDRLQAAAFKLCHDEHLAEDLAFATIEKGVAHISDCEGDAVLFSWLYVILLNLHRNTLRRRSVRDVIVSEELTKSTEVPDENAAIPGQGLDDADLHRAVEMLPREMRDAVVMHYFMDIPIVDIARSMRVPTGTVKSRLHYGRLALAEIIRRTARKGAVWLIAFGLGLAALFLQPGPSVERLPESPEEVRLSSDLGLVFRSCSLARLQSVFASDGAGMTIRCSVAAEDGIQLLNDGLVAVAINEHWVVELVQMGGDIWGRVTGDECGVLSLSAPVFGEPVETTLFAGKRGGVR